LEKILLTFDKNNKLFGDKLGGQSRFFASLILLNLGKKKSRNQPIELTSTMGSKKRSRVANVPAEQPKNSIDWDEQSSKKKAKKEVDSDDDGALDTLLPVEALTEQITNEDFRIVAGSYERILYGINAFWETDDDQKVVYKIRNDHWLTAYA
jgi:hypothetical protein